MLCMQGRWTASCRSVLCTICCPSCSLRLRTQTRGWHIGLPELWAERATAHDTSSLGAGINALFMLTRNGQSGRVCSTFYEVPMKGVQTADAHHGMQLVAA